MGNSTISILRMGLYQIGGFDGRNDPLPIKLSLLNASYGMVGQVKGQIFHRKLKSKTHSADQRLRFYSQSPGALG